MLQTSTTPLKHYPTFYSFHPPQTATDRSTYGGLPPSLAGGAGGGEFDDGGDDNDEVNFLADAWLDSQGWRVGNTLFGGKTPAANGGS